jgi:hypothetical protein
MTHRELHQANWDLNWNKGKNFFQRFKRRRKIRKLSKMLRELPYEDERITKALNDLEWTYITP